MMSELALSKSTCDFNSPLTIVRWVASASVQVTKVTSDLPGVSSTTATSVG